MSLEEKAKEYFSHGLNVTPDGFVEIQEHLLYSCMAAFAKTYAYDKLEEAAEKVFNQTISPSRNEIYEDGYRECQKEAQESILNIPLK